MARRRPGRDLPRDSAPGAATRRGRLPPPPGRVRRSSVPAAIRRSVISTTVEPGGTRPALLPPTDRHRRAHEAAWRPSSGMSGENISTMETVTSGSRPRSAPTATARSQACTNGPSPYRRPPSPPTAQTLRRSRPSTTGSRRVQSSTVPPSPLTRGTTQWRRADQRHESWTPHAHLRSARWPSSPWS